MKYDLIVVGGGFSGVSAAVSGAKRGLKTLLIEKNGALGGAATNCLVVPFMSYLLKYKRRIIKISDGYFGRILTLLKEKGGLGKNGHLFNEEILKIILDEEMEKFGVDVLFHSFVTGVEKDGEKITAVITAGKSGTQKFTADYFIDCTGDADIAYLAGAPVNLGRESDNLCQPMTLCFRLSGVNVKKALKMRPEINALYKKWQDDGKIKNPRENILVFKNMNKDVLHFNSTRIIKKNPVDVKDLSFAEKEARKQVLEIYNFLKENFEPFKKSVLLSTASEIGVRESRKIDGEYFLTEKDVLSLTKFEDRISACNYSIDIHNPEGVGTYLHYFGVGEYYTIPYRCLQPKKVENLLVAGRCISTDHTSQASYRIMPVCATLGEAAGTAVAVAKRTDKKVKEIDVKLLQKELIDAGAFIG